MFPERSKDNESSDNYDTKEKKKYETKKTHPSPLKVARYLFREITGYIYLAALKCS
jgi:hypothetical protein